METPEARNQKQVITDRETLLGLLDDADIGFLGLHTGEYPYVVPVNFTREGDSIYVHSSPTGMKIDCIRRDATVCLTVLGKHDYLDGVGNYSYQCAIVYGRASLITDQEEILEAYRSLCSKIDPVVMSDVNDDCIGRSAIIRIEIEEITGKKGSRD